ncbi:hypothetical protein BVRB_020820, partial [Beta vulgaris subsp. vulgaris]
YSTEGQRVALVGSLLTCDALTWFPPLFEANDPVLAQFELFMTALKARFDDPHRQRTAASRLQVIRQLCRPASAYTTEFQLLLADAGWDNTAAMHIFKTGLNSDVRDLLLSLPEPTNLSTLVTQAIDCDERIHQRRAKQRASSSSIPPVPSSSHTTSNASFRPSSDHVPMQLDTITTNVPVTSGHRRARLDNVERQRRIDEGLCIYCAKPVHIVRTCPDIQSGNAPGRH